MKQQKTMMQRINAAGTAGQPKLAEQSDPEFEALVDETAQESEPCGLLRDGMRGETLLCIPRRRGSGRERREARLRPSHATPIWCAEDSRLTVSRLRAARSTFWIRTAMSAIWARGTVTTAGHEAYWRRR